MRCFLSFMALALFLGVPAAFGQDFEPIFETRLDHFMPAYFDPLSAFPTDYDNDGDTDVVLADYNGTRDDFCMFVNNGDGEFTSRFFITHGLKTWQIFAADLDGDTYDDLIATHGYHDSLSVTMNNGDGTFAPNVSYYLLLEPDLVYAADFDGDTDIDIITIGYQFSDSMAVLINNGDGTFGAPSYYDVPSSTTDILSLIHI